MWWHLFSFSTGAWALAGAGGILVLATHRGSRRFLARMLAEEAGIVLGVLMGMCIVLKLHDRRRALGSKP